jgi:hypothetical protein
MEMDLLNRQTVRFRLRFRDNPENPQGNLKRARRQLSRFQNPDDISQIPAVMMVVMSFMVMIVVMVMILMTVFMVMVTMAVRMIMVFVAVLMIMILVTVFMVMVFMAVSVIMISMAVPMLVLFCQYGRPETVRVQISHIVVMILMFAVKDYVEIAGIQAGLDNTRDCNPVTGKRQRIQCFLQQLFIRPQIQKRRNQHISADSAGTVKNQRFSSFFQSFLHNLIPCSFYKTSVL